MNNKYENVYNRLMKAKEDLENHIKMLSDEQGYWRWPKISIPTRNN